MTPSLSSLVGMAMHSVAAGPLGGIHRLIGAMYEFLEQIFDVDHASWRGDDARETDAGSHTIGCGCTPIRSWRRMSVLLIVIHWSHGGHDHFPAG